MTITPGAVVVLYMGLLTLATVWSLRRYFWSEPAVWLLFTFCVSIIVIAALVDKPFNKAYFTNNLTVVVGVATVVNGLAAALAVYVSSATARQARLKEEQRNRPNIQVDLDADLTLDYDKRHGYLNVILVVANISNTAAM